MAARVCRGEALRAMQWAHGLTQRFDLRPEPMAPEGGGTEGVAAAAACVPPAPPGAAAARAPPASVDAVAGANKAAAPHGQAPACAPAVEELELDEPPARVAHGAATTSVLRTRVLVVVAALAAFGLIAAARSRALARMHRR